MASRYLLHFAHEHVSFRWTEFLALTKKHDCNFFLISDIEHITSRPYILIELPTTSNEDALVKCARDSYMLKSLYELWARSTISLEDLSLKASRSPQFLSKLYHGSEQTFRVDCESFGVKLLQSTKVEMIRKMTFMEDFEARPNLKQPAQNYCIFEIKESESEDGTPKKEYFFGRQITKSDRNSIDKFSLKTRTFIANTSMDPMLSLISANAAKVGQNDIVYDPFVGSGSLLVAAAYKGAYVLGADIDWKLLHGKSRPSRFGQKRRDEGENVRANMLQYDLSNRYLDIMVSDITRSPLHDAFKIDAVISDPPYGVRECSEKIGSKGRERKYHDDKIRYPSKVVYSMTELLDDLLRLSAKHLKPNGRLVYYLPVVKIDDGFDVFIPRHPCLKLLSYCEEGLTKKISRLMIVMEKIREPVEGDKPEVPQLISSMNLRETYFSSRGE